MAQSSIDPYLSPQAYDYCKIGGQTNPGIIAPGGVTGFKRPTEWETKKGKGTKGGTTTLTQLPPAKGSIKFLLWDDTHFAAWDNSFRALFKYDPTRANITAVDLYHPALAKLDIHSVVVENIGPETAEGKGLWSITVDLLEYLPPPKATASATPSGSAANTNKSGSSGNPPDPIADAQQKEIASLLAKAQQP